MGSDETLRLGDVCAKIGSGATPRGGKDSYKGGATALVRSQNVYNHGFERDGLVFIDDNQAADLSNVELCEGDVLLNITGDSVARCCQIARDVLPARVNQHVAIIRTKPQTLDARFLRYVLVSPDFQSHLLALASAGATRNALTKGMIENLTVPRRELSEQKRIAHILGTLDDKIELNHRMNATLEAMARALFQSWFVDFDPVRAKAFGQPPAGMDPATADLFPSDFENSELGEIPKGWKVKVTGDFVKRLPVGQKYEQKTVLPMGTIPVLDQGKSGIIGYHNNLPGVQSSTDEPVAVFANHTCYMRLIPFPFSAIQNVLPFVGKDVSTLWAYYATEGKVQFSEYKGHWPDFVIQKIVVPTPEATDLFAETIKPAVSLIWMNEEQSRTLAALRDTLLPKLLSGELSVVDPATEVS